MRHEKKLIKLTVCCGVTTLVYDDFSITMWLSHVKMRCPLCEKAYQELNFQQKIWFSVLQMFGKRTIPLLKFVGADLLPAVLKVKANCPIHGDKSYTLNGPGDPQAALTPYMTIQPGDMCFF